LNEILADLQRGAFVSPQRLTLEEYLTDWLRSLPAQGRRRTTIESYGRHVRLHVLAKPIADMQLQSVGPLDLDRLYAHLLAEGRADGGGGLSPRTVRFVHGVLSKAFADAVRKRLVLVNPCAAADAPSPKSTRPPEPTTWTAAELATFLRQREADRHFALWRVLAMTGARRGEALGLRWRDLELDDGVLRVRQSVLPVGGEPIFDTVKSDRSRRTVTLDAGTIAALRAHRARQAKERLALGAGYRDHDLVFALPDGRPYYPPRIGDAFTWRVAKSGLPRIRLHDLRHTHATLLLAQATDAKTVSERLGHSSVQFTLDRYTHPKTSTHHAAADRFGELVDGAANDA